MTLVLTGASLYVLHYTDSKGAERTVRIKKGTDVETLGLSDSVLEDLATITYSEYPKRYYFSRETDEHHPRKGTVRIKASKKEAGVPESTISMAGMRKELAVSRGEIVEAKEKKAASIKDDGIRRAWSEPSFDKGGAQGTRAKELSDSEKAVNDQALELEYEHPQGAIEAVVQMNAEITKVPDVQPVSVEGPEDAPKKMPVKRVSTKKPGPKTRAKKTTKKKAPKKTPKNNA